jgi:hypothetical protein
MKKTSLSAKLSLLLLVCCVIILALLIYRQHLNSTRLENVLSFAKVEFDECRIEYSKINEQAPPDPDGVVRTTLHKHARLEASAARKFAKQLASGTRQYTKKILPGVFFNFGPTHEIVFKSKDSVCEFHLGYKHTGSHAYIEYRAKNPTLEGTIFLARSAGLELESLIESFAAEEPSNNNKL